MNLASFAFDNTTITEVMEPSISSLDVNTYELGVQAADILINQIENPTVKLAPDFTVNKND